MGDAQDKGAASVPTLSEDDKILAKEAYDAATTSGLKVSLSEHGELLDESGAVISKRNLKKIKAGKFKPEKKKDKPKFNAPKAKAKKTGKKIEFVNKTPKGEKKDLSEMADQYYPAAVEAAWDAWWEQKGFYSASPKTAAAAGEKDRFVMVIPPPNVTGSLHLGHALTDAVEDTLARWHRMQGKPTLWLPGMDHAGIATQAVVEKRLAKEQNLTRHDLGREKFIDEVWKWKELYGGKIKDQMRRLGVSVDWTRERFTMDEMLSRAVKEAFVRMYDDNLIYRDTRLVNWCSKLRTAVADIEVDHIDIEKRTFMRVPGHDENKKYEFGVLTSFAYKFADSDDEIVVATTRLETMLGDVAVAVHPEDPRYTNWHGKLLRHPFNDRLIPIVTDSELVDMNFGTGAVKITPAHDPNDFLCGRRNKLPEINVLNDDGTINHEGGEFEGMMRFDARVAVEKALEAKGLLRGKADNKMRLGLCSRSGDVIEPMLKPQWWVNCSGMAKRAADAVRNGDLDIQPEFHRDTWFRWLDNIRDWCVSRQLWWGHRIPAYLAHVHGQPRSNSADAKNWFVGRDEDEARARAAEAFGVSADQVELNQDEDVLDTWFSSGLFPFSVFGWPDVSAEDLEAFYPNTLLETGHDIIFFWVARMVMMGLQLTDKLPFKTVYLHAMVRDKYGRKMSKSLGNVIDPLEVISGCSLEKLHEKLYLGNLPPKEIEKAKVGQKKEFPEGIPECGADALRLGLLAYTVQGRDVNLDINRVVGYRNFCNKMWNATRFALSHLQGGKFPHEWPVQKVYHTLEEAANKNTLAPRDRWILNRMNACIRDVNEHFKNYVFGEAVSSLYSFWLYELCDVYLELSKPVFAAQSGEDTEEAKLARLTLYACLDTGLRLLHPIMPFVTEELWQRLPGRGGKWDETTKDPESIMIAPFPMEIATFDCETIENDMASVKELIHSIRSLRSEANLKPSQEVQVYVVTEEAQFKSAIEAQVDDIKTLARASSVRLLSSTDKVPTGCAANVLSDKIIVHVMMKGLIDADAEIKRLQKEIQKKISSVESTEHQMNMSGYEEKVPADVREKNAERLAALKTEIEVLQQSVVKMEEWK